MLGVLKHGNSIVMYYVHNLNYFVKKCIVFRSFGNTLFYSFLGIPYAQPPIGQLRYDLMTIRIILKQD